MFWRHAKHHYSISAKLNILYAISSLAIITAVCLFLYPTFATLVTHLNDNASADIKISCYKNLVIALLFSAISALVLGKMVTYNGLKGLKKFAEQLQTISADSLHSPIDVKYFPEEVRGLGREFNSMLHRLQKSFDQLNQFSSDIAHELRTPLHNLQIRTELALTHQQLPPEYSSILESYMDEYKHLTKLVDSLLFLARSDQSQLTLNKQSIDVFKEISTVVDYYQLLAEEKNIALHCEGDGLLWVDLTLFKRAINNLLLNAIKYTPKKGAIGIKISADAQWINIVIQDTGIGIEELHLPRIFDRFYRVDTSRSPESGGLGLGLAIVKCIVELHGGTIQITSIVNKGTSVSMCFPKVYGQ